MNQVDWHPEHPHIGEDLEITGSGERENMQREVEFREMKRHSESGPSLFRNY
jgi:hypothetical protein